MSVGVAGVKPQKSYFFTDNALKDVRDERDMMDKALDEVPVPGYKLSGTAYHIAA